MDERAFSGFHLSMCLTCADVPLQSIEQDVDSIRDEYIKLKEKILKKLEGIPDPDKVKFLRVELNLINQKLGSLEGFASSHTERQDALLLRNMTSLHRL